MLGMGWFPSTLGGLDRYYRSLYEQLPEATGVVLGPAADTPASLTVVSREQAPLWHRLLAYWRAARAAIPDAEVVDMHFALYAALPMLLGGRGDRRAVFHFHGPWADEHLASGTSSRLGFALRSRLERMVLARADAHVVLSGAFRRVLVERYGIAPWNVRVLRPGVDLDTFTPEGHGAARERLGVAEGAFVAVCVRRLVARMGIGVLLDAWGRIAAELPPGSLLLIAGDGPLREQLAARGAEHPGVRLLGRVTDSELVDLYRAADVAVVPSISFEGFGLVVLEAAACGTPSVVSDLGGLPEVAAPLEPSLVVAAGDAEALAERLGRAAAGELPTREETRRYAEGFAWQEVAARHRALYRSLRSGTRDERTRVVYLDHIARLSGGEIALLRLLPHLREVDAHVILGEDGPLAQRLQQEGISVEVLPISSAARDLRRDTVRPGAASPLAALHTLAYVIRLAVRLRRLRPDLVHTNSLKAGVYGSLAAKLAGVPLLWHVRDRIADDYIPKPAVRLVRMLVRHLADGVGANSQATLETLSPATLRRPHAALPDSVLAPDRARTLDPHAITFGMVGRIAPWKGQDLFLRAFAATFPQGDERAVVVGSAMFGEEPYESALHELAEQLGLSDRVEFRGFREDVWTELAGFDVLVHASVIPEPFGQVVLEGMAAGLAVIAPDEGGPAAVIADGDTGRLFRSRDAEALAGAMRALGESRSERERLGAQAALAVAEYHPDALAPRWEALYREVLESVRNVEV
ncbi:MAG: glycosyltransferase family 4 protein [Solirubrobacteraceae bacterium]